MIQKPSMPKIGTKKNEKTRKEMLREDWNFAEFEKHDKIYGER